MDLNTDRTHPASLAVADGGGFPLFLALTECLCHQRTNTTTLFFVFVFVIHVFEVHSSSAQNDATCPPHKTLHTRWLGVAHGPCCAVRPFSIANPCSRTTTWFSGASRALTEAQAAAQPRQEAVEAPGQAESVPAREGTACSTGDDSLSCLSQRQG